LKPFLPALHHKPVPEQIKMLKLEFDEAVSAY